MPNESKLHKALKAKATEFLVDLGCTDIIEEYPLIRRPPKKGARCVDVVGFRDGEAIAVECGGSTEQRLRSIVDIVSELYVLPYGETKPYRYKKHTNLCPYCGHKV